MHETFSNVRSWASILDGVTRAQAASTSKLPILRAPLALMPDAHLGTGATIGSVLVTDDAVIPSAVGVDIGCGMAARRVNLVAPVLEDYDVSVRKRWLAAMGELVPAGLGKWHGDVTTAAEKWIDENPPPKNLDKSGVERAAMQLGTLGSGNHFVELSVDEDAGIWILLHSGSRGAGNKLAQLHVRTAKALTGAQAAAATQSAEGRDLAWLVSGTPEFSEYLGDLDWSQRYAKENRRQLLELSTMALSIAVNEFGIRVLDEVNCHHNYAVQEYVVELGRNAYVTRKGAIRAGISDRGLIPGAMGQASFIVRGRGNPDSYESCSHGAGRVMSRTRARKEIPLESFTEEMNGVVWQKDDAKSLLDEHPKSYKPVEQVMADQADLVEVEHTLRAVANFKGVEHGRR